MAKKKEVINVIELDDNSVEKVKSFIVEDEKNRDIVVREAEEYFINVAGECGMKMRDIEKAIEDGYYSKDSHTVCISWSN